MSEWIKYNGDGPPVPNGTPVEVMQRDGKVKSYDRFGYLVWRIDDRTPGEDVMFWRPAHERL
jgi:hypothetical protein